MKLLALSTSSKVLSCAVFDGEACLASVTPSDGRRHAETVILSVEAALKQAGLSLGELDAMAVDVGPGSFTGVRIGVTAVNAMAFACRIPVIPVDSLAILHEASNPGHPCCAIVNAQNGNAYATVYDAEGTELMPASAVTLEELKARLPDGCMFTGDVPDVCPAITLPDAVTLGHVAVKKGIGCGVKEARPMYLRPSQAERKAAGNVK